MSSITADSFKGKSAGLKWKYIIAGLLILNFGIRLLIWFNTRLFSFSDYSLYLSAIDNIANGGKQYLLNGNMLFAISYIGYFFKYVLGNFDYFFIFNSLLGTLSSLIICILVVKITGSYLAGTITIILHSLYTEFMVFSSVFYTPVLMIFLVSLFLLFIYLFLEGNNKTTVILSLISAIIIFSLTFFFKPELKYLPVFMLLAGLVFLKKNVFAAQKILLLAFLLSPFSFLLPSSGLITHPPGNVISNDFVMFGHTDYGGDGGEGAFVYPENRRRFIEAGTEYFRKNNISSPQVSDYNAFNRNEIRKFITDHPFKWIKLQAVKFFRTFGIVPEGTSFKVLYTGLLKDKLWLTAIVVSAPVAFIIIMFIVFFNFPAYGTQHAVSLTPPAAHRPPHTAYRTPHTAGTTGFLLISLTLFVYYIIATIFYGHYQERYRMPVMVLFIIPALGYFISVYNKNEFYRRSSLILRSLFVLMFLTIWIFQTKRAVSEKVRLEKVIELKDKR